jgi:outer membrane protein TolC
VSSVGWRRWGTLALLAAGGLAGIGAPVGWGQERLPVPRPLLGAAPPSLSDDDRPLPIDLPTALRLAGVQPLDIAAAARQIQVAAAQLRQAQVLWLPTVYLGTDYARHEGQIQDSTGNVSGNSHSAFMLGAGPSAVFALTDALFAPLAARQELQARQAALQTARNDSLLAVAEAYFNVQQARGNLAAAEHVSRLTEAMVRRARELVPSGLVPELEVVRAQAAAAASRQAVQTARERWRLHSADLVRLLRLDPSTVVEPREPPELRITLLSLDQSVDDLIRLGLTNRPELAKQQALVRATLERLRQEKLRPLLPSVLLRGFSTPVTGTLAGGLFGGGSNGELGNFGARADFDLQFLWELRNLGLGNQALVQQRRAEQLAAAVELFRTQDRVAAEVAQAFAQARSAAARLTDAETELRQATDSANKNLQALGQTKTAGNLLILVVRPVEVIIAVQALGQAYSDYYAAVADYDRAQFRLYHALGRPAQAITDDGAACAGPGPDGAPARARLGPPLPAATESAGP